MPKYIHDFFLNDPDITHIEMVTNPKINTINIALIF